MAELVDVQDLGSCVERRKGSSPFTSTIVNKLWLYVTTDKETQDIVSPLFISDKIGGDTGE